MFSLIAMNFELITLSPQYAQFGSQHYTDVVRSRDRGRDRDRREKTDRDRDR